MGKKRIARKAERVHKNPVTGELEVTVLDDVQLAFERCVQVIEGKMLGFGSDEAAAAKRRRLAERLLGRVALMLPRADGNEDCATRKAG